MSLIYMLDTNVIVDLMRKTPRREVILASMRKYEPSNFCISAITFAELASGVEKTNNPYLSKIGVSLALTGIEILDFKQEDAELYGQVRARLERKGRPIGAMDTLIASHALSQGLIIVTHNVRDFSRVDGLEIEDWLAD